jgi:hypothetical protein
MPAGTSGRCRERGKRVGAGHGNPRTRNVRDFEHAYKCRIISISPHMHRHCMHNSSSKVQLYIYRARRPS